MSVDPDFLYKYRAICTDVYDGDTITVDIDLGFRVWMKGEKIRLFGINAPEMRGPEKNAGTVTRNRLRAVILGKEFQLHSVRDKVGKYGRWLGMAWVDVNGEPLNINAWLVAEGLAKAQDY